MGSIADQLQTATAPQSVLEASLGRVWQHHKRGFAIMSAWRQDNTSQQNDDATRRLKAALKSFRFGFVPIEGAGQEDSAGGPVDRVEEIGVLIPLVGDPADFRSKILGLAGEFKQYSVLIHNPETGTEETRPSGDIVGHMTKFTPGKGKFFSRLLRGDRRAFKLESAAWWGIKYASPPEGSIRGMSRHADGELLGEFTDRMEDWLEMVGKADVLTGWQEQVLSEIASAGRYSLPESDRKDVRERRHIVAGLVRRGLVELTGRQGGTFGLTQRGQERVPPLP